MKRVEMTMQNGMSHGGSMLIDTSVSERAIREGRKMYCKQVSEQVMLKLADMTTDPKELIKRAWLLAELQYDETMRRQAAPDLPVTLTERMAADNMVASAAR
jgi:hypothetical protein